MISEEVKNKIKAFYIEKKYDELIKFTENISISKKLSIFVPNSFASASCYYYCNIQNLNNFF